MINIAQLAKGGADRRSPSDDTHHVGDGCVIGAAERAARRLLHVDQSRAAGQGGFSFGGGTHTY